MLLLALCKAKFSFLISSIISPRLTRELSFWNSSVNVLNCENWFNSGLFVRPVGSGWVYARWGRGLRPSFENCCMLVVVLALGVACLVSGVTAVSVSVGVISVHAFLVGAGASIYFGGSVLFLVRASLFI